MTQRRRGEPLPLGDGGLPYSKGLMARALIAVGVPADHAYQLARRIELDLAERGLSAIEVDRLDEIAREVLGEQEGERAVDRLRRLDDLQALDVPIVLMIGGSTGTGKSTVAAEVAHRLGITRVASTDFIRQTMRAFFSPEFMPTIHFSSFEAGEALDQEVTGDPTVVGFVDQCSHVCVGVEAAIRRALTEGWSMVLEGVHLVPGLLPAGARGCVARPRGDRDRRRGRAPARISMCATRQPAAFGRWTSTLGNSMPSAGFRPTSSAGHAVSGSR